MDARALLEMEIQGPDGSVEGPVDLHLIRERIYAGRYRGNEQVRIQNGTWRGMVSFPELAEVLALVGVDVQAMQIRDRQSMTGWKAAGDQEPAKSAAPQVAPVAPDSVEPIAEKPKKKVAIPVIVAVVAAMAAVSLAVLFLR